MESLNGAAKVYGENGLTLVTPSSASEDAVAGSEWLFSSLFSARREAGFLANYSRNVLGHKLASIIYDRAGSGAAMAEEYENTYLLFGTAIHYKWSFDHSAPDVDGQLASI